MKVVIDKPLHRWLGERLVRLSINRHLHKFAALEPLLTWVQITGLDIYEDSYAVYDYQ
ncbi:MAG: hypothetical protein AAF526_00235 [Pseudomonadota bacterium]